MTKSLAAVLAACAICGGQEVTIKTRVPLVVASTSVTDRDGHVVNGLGGEDFELIDNGKPQRIQVDTTDIALIPISLVIAVQVNGSASAAVAKVRKIGSMIEPLLTGARGDVAVLAFNEKLSLLQDFTSDAGLITRSMKALKASGGNARVIDAAGHAVELLSQRPRGRRKFVLLISESRDRGSESKLPDVLKQAQLHDVTLHTMTFSAHATAWTTRPSDNGPPGDSGGGFLLGTVIELARLGKTNAAEEIARFSGGKRLSFLTLHSLESEITRLGEDMHSQYLLSFTPDTEADGTFHVMEVRVKRHPEYAIRTRPGYWALPGQ